MPQYVFISHLSSDKPRIEAILLALLEAGAHLWIDRPQDFAGQLDAYRTSGQIGSIQYGEDWDKIIDRELPISPLILGFISKAALESEQVILELLKARRHKTLVPIYLERIYGSDLPSVAAFLLKPQGPTFFATETDAREREIREVVDFALERLAIGPLVEARRTAATLVEAQRRIAAHFFGSEENITCKDVLLGHMLTCRLVPTRPTAPIKDCAPLYIGETPLLGGEGLERPELEAVLGAQADLWRLPSKSEVSAIVDPLGVCTAGAPHPFGLSIPDTDAFWARSGSELIVVDRLGASTNLATGVAFLVYLG